MLDYYLLVMPLVKVAMPGRIVELFHVLLQFRLTTSLMLAPIFKHFAKSALLIMRSLNLTKEKKPSKFY